MENASTDQDLRTVDEVFERIACDLSMLADRELAVREVVSERAESRPAGEGSVHISYRFGIVRGEQAFHGTLLVPLADSITLAAFLMMSSDEAVAELRSRTSLDESLKDAILEVGNFVTGAIDAAMRAIDLNDASLRFEGCQGVRDGVRPALTYDEGAPLLIGRAQLAIAEFEPAEILLVLPVDALDE